jgi:hypothetical protein
MLLPHLLLRPTDASFANKKSIGMTSYLWRRYAFLRSAEHLKYSVDTTTEDHNDGATFVRTQTIVSPAAAVALEESRQSPYGFLYLGFRLGHFTFALRLFGVSIWMACVTVFLSDSSQLQVFLIIMGLVSFLQVVTVAVERPYDSWRTNFFKVLVGLETVLMPSSCSDCRRRPRTMSSSRSCSRSSRWESSSYCCDIPVAPGRPKVSLQVRMPILLQPSPLPESALD